MIEDPFLSLNVEKSIQKHRLIYRTGFFMLFSYMMYCLMTVAGIFVLRLFGALIIKLTGAPSYMETLWGIAVVIWALIDTWVMHPTLKINGSGDSASNRKLLHEALTIKYPRASRMKNTKAYVRYQKGRIYPSLSTSISCLFDGGDVYLNVMSLGRGDSLFAFFGIINYYRCKRLAKSLSKENKEKYECSS
ncbi:hypothetical protein [Mucilaginibacter psychrotolerans]|uniref:Uncharacterized protein n=1 Tax=Mucilaginibacter psychrotolerans TaxID=1524096 RepID=A0A4Y8S6G4_9SPHI|nr:hypothetical protein [Mucilaginibacter psychrotolerans]TFF34336.1 hypothetical protein E2R66_22650 [Mucilaginibacter psychrotolerans]